MLSPIILSYLLQHFYPHVMPDMERARQARLATRGLCSQRVDRAPTRRRRRYRRCSGIAPRRSRWRSTGTCSTRTFRGLARGARARRRI